MTANLKASIQAGTLAPARVITIAVDTGYLYNQTSGPNVGAGVYMFDNNVLGGSTGEGTLELVSHVKVGSTIGFNVFPIDALGQFGDSVQIVSFAVSNGTIIFGIYGGPTPQNHGTYQWLAQAMNAGNCACQIKVGVSVGGAGMKYYSWIFLSLVPRANRGPARGVMVVKDGHPLNRRHLPKLTCNGPTLDQAAVMIKVQGISGP